MAKPDNWINRSKGMICKTCVWFVIKEKKGVKNTYCFGRCRRYAPTLKGFVPVFDSDWCGEHKLDENKI